MLSEIGITSGQIWKYLDKNGEVTALKLKSALGITNTVLYMGIGWLAREGKINVVEYAKGYKISLKK
ncbi:MAG: winged helix-turn-helix domain-containing protein [Elusimicrobiota bacterium]|nr:winged helix-turn-helix domain-containing protein [Elusimicrobiota bacterium]